jgi:hypothetical protein
MHLTSALRSAQDMSDPSPTDTLNTLSHCVLPEPVVKFLESRKMVARGDKRYVPDPAVTLDDTFLTTLPENQLLFPKVFLGTCLFTATPLALQDRPVDTEITAPGAKTPIRYVGPELRRNDAMLYGALVGMSRGFRPGLPMRVGGEQLFRVLGVDVPQQNECLQRLAQAQVEVSGIRFPLVELVDQSNPRHWWFCLGTAQAEFLRRTVITAVPMDDVSDVRQALAFWLLLASAGGRLSVPAKRTALRETCGYAASRDAFSDALHAARRALEAHDTDHARRALACIRGLFR